MLASIGAQRAATSTVPRTTLGRTIFSRQIFSRQITMAHQMRNARQQPQRRLFQNQSQWLEPKFTPAEELMLDGTAWLVALTFCWTPQYTRDNLSYQDHNDMQEEAQIRSRHESEKKKKKQRRDDSNRNNNGHENHNKKP